MAQLIADKMGTKDKFDEGKTEEDMWIRDLYEQARAKNAALPTFEEAQEQGVVVTKGKKKISMEKFIADPVASALDTPSGKIEIFSEKLLKDTVGWEVAKDDTVSGLDTVLAVPAYIPEWYGVESTTDEYPLALGGFHYRGRLHSSWGGIEELKEVNPQEAWINPADAEASRHRAGRHHPREERVRRHRAAGQGHAARGIPGTVAGFPGRVARRRYVLGRPQGSPGQGRQHQHADYPASLARWRRATRSTPTSAKS